MSMRTFQSSTGVAWRVWCVIPGGLGDSERRRGYDRRSPDPVLRYPGPERRVSEDRRAGFGFFSPDLRDGWLTFESDTERRRLAPVPPSWDTLPESSLERLCQRATPVPFGSPSP
jgi:hypothetical protein